jgi:hypothetical protein
VSGDTLKVTSSGENMEANTNILIPELDVTNPNDHETISVDSGFALAGQSKRVVGPNGEVLVASCAKEDPDAGVGLAAKCFSVSLLGKDAKPDAAVEVSGALPIGCVQLGVQMQFLKKDSAYKIDAKICGKPTGFTGKPILLYGSVKPQEFATKADGFTVDLKLEKKTVNGSAN